MFSVHKAPPVPKHWVRDVTFPGQEDELIMENIVANDDDIAEEVRRRRKKKKKKEKKRDRKDKEKEEATKAKLGGGGEEVEAEVTVHRVQGAPVIGALLSCSG